MNEDLQNILGNWKYDSSSLNARKIIGMDGKPKIQLRMDLGVLQMETDGRPDGRRPHGYESLLEHLAVLANGQDAKSEEFFDLTPEMGVDLQQEAAQYYYRYLANYALREYPQVVADTQHNLDIIDFVDHHTEDDELAWQFMQFYPYVRMMNARAISDLTMAKEDLDGAVRALEEGIADIREFWRLHDDEGPDAHPREIESLSATLQELLKQRPKSQDVLLKEELARAVAAENYERAATLRDALKKISPSSS